jgi:hypothetical protein
VLEGKESASDKEEEEYFEEEEIQSPKAKQRKTPPTTPSMLTKKRVSIMKPAAQQNMSMADLNKSTARMGLTDIQMNVGGVSIPILRGS